MVYKVLFCVHCCNWCRVHRSATRVSKSVSTKFILSFFFKDYATPLIRPDVSCTLNSTKLSLQEMTPLLQGHFFILKGTLFNRRATVIFQRFNLFTSIKIKFIWGEFKTGSWHFITKVPYIRFWHIKLYNRTYQVVHQHDLDHSQNSW